MPLDDTYQPCTRADSAPAVVLCGLADTGAALSAVRSLGEPGLRVILIAESDCPPARYSRHCSRFVHVPGFSRHPLRLARALREIEGEWGIAPVVFATGAADLKALRQVMPALGPRIRPVPAPAERPAERPVALPAPVQIEAPAPQGERVTVEIYLRPDGEVGACCSSRALTPEHADRPVTRESVSRPALETRAAQVLTEIGHRGIAHIDFQHDPQTGEYRLLAMHPLPSPWHLLATRSGHNLPLLAWREACGLPAARAPRQRTGLRHVDEVQAWRDWQAQPDAGSRRWLPLLGVLMRPGTVRQTLGLGDPGPALQLARAWLARRGIWREAPHRPTATLFEEAERPCLRGR